MQKRKLGTRQTAMLAAMKRMGGQWYPGCGSIWVNRSTTIKIMESLELAGLVREDGRVYRLTKPAQGVLNV